jgi:hypothetical protein
MSDYTSGNLATIAPKARQETTSFEGMPNGSQQG